jgi:CelD/BcsL family acetyltransferase involved in cellulose biosynthesis
MRHYDEFIEVEASGWKGGQGTRSAIKLNANICSFYRELVSTFAFPGNCEINLLKAGSSCLAGQFCLRVGDTYNILKIGYDETYSAMAPGNILLDRLLQDISTRKMFTRVDLISDMAWHRNWRAAQEDVFTLYLFNRSPRGIGAWSFMQARNMVRGLRHTLLRRSPAADAHAA